MVLLSYAAFGLLLALPISLVLGASRRRQWLLALSGPAVLVTLVVLALARGCSPDARYCSTELTLFYGAYLGGVILIGWFAGIGLAALVRRLRQPRSGSSASQGVR